MKNNTGTQRIKIYFFNFLTELADLKNWISESQDWLKEFQSDSRIYYGILYDYTIYVPWLALIQGKLFNCKVECCLHDQSLLRNSRNVLILDTSCAGAH